MAQVTELNDAQLELLKLFEMGTTQQELKDLKRLIKSYYVKKAREAVDKQTKGWTQQDFDALLQAPRKKKP